MKCECTLNEFVKKYPVFKSAFQNLVTDPQYIAKFTIDKNGKLSFVEVGYKTDGFVIDSMGS